MASPIVVQAYIERLCRETGTDSLSVYNKNTGAWYFKQDATTIEVFISSHLTPHGTVRNFIRCFSPLPTLPLAEEKKLALYKTALELNEEHTGIKIAIDNSKKNLCVIGERDTDGMDYQEMLTIIIDTGNLAARLNVLLKDYF